MELESLCLSHHQRGANGSCFLSYLVSPLWGGHSWNGLRETSMGKPPFPGCLQCPDLPSRGQSAPRDVP